MTATQSFSYKPKLLPVLLALCFFLGCLATMAYALLFEDRQVILENIVELGPGGSKIYFLLMAAASLFPVALSVMAIRASLMPDRRILLSPTHVTIPASILSRRRTDIALGDITGLSLQTERSGRILHIRHGGGTTKATQRFFQDRHHFEHFMECLQTALRR